MVSGINRIPFTSFEVQACRVIGIPNTHKELIIAFDDEKGHATDIYQRQPVVFIYVIIQDISLSGSNWFAVNCEIGVGWEHGNDIILYGDNPDVARHTSRQMG